MWRMLVGNLSDRKTLLTRTEDAAHQVKGTKKEKMVENELMAQKLCYTFRQDLMRVRKARILLIQTVSRLLVVRRNVWSCWERVKVGVLCNTYFARCSFPRGFMCCAHVVKCSCFAWVVRCSELLVCAKTTFHSRGIQLLVHASDDRAPRKFVARVVDNMCWWETSWSHRLPQVMTAGGTQESKKAIEEQQLDTELMDEETTIQRELMDAP